MAKEKCDCGEFAVWMYGPISNRKNPFYCDKHVLSEEDTLGCSCNWHYEKETEYSDKPEGVEGKDWKYLVYSGDSYMNPITLEEKFWIYIDESGRPYPCVEYMYDEEGFDVPTLVDNLTYFIQKTKSRLKANF